MSTVSVVITLVLAALVAAVVYELSSTPGEDNIGKF